MTDTKPPEQSNDAEKHLEHATQPKEHAESHVRTEAEKGKSELVKAQKEHNKHLKAGGKSGISDAFGSAKAIWGAALDEMGKALDEQAHKQVAQEALLARQRQLDMERSLAPSLAASVEILVRAGDASPILKILQDNKTPEQLYFIEQAYKSAFGRNLQDDLKSKCSGGDLTKTLDLLHKAKAPEIPALPATPAHTDAAAQKLAPQPEKQEVARKESKTQAPADQPINQAKVTDVTADLLTYTSFEKDADKIVNLLQSSSQSEIEAYKSRYKTATGIDLAQQLARTYDGNDLKRIQHFLNRKDSDAVQIPSGMDRLALENDNEALHLAIKKGPGGAYEITTMLSGKTPEELKAMDSLYKQRYGLSLDDEMRGSSFPLSLETHVSMAAAHKANEEQHRKEDEAATIGGSVLLRHNANTIEAVLAGKTQAEIKEIEATFQKKYNQSLEDYLKSYLEGSERNKALELLHHKDSDLAALPGGVDRNKMRAAIEEIHDSIQAGGPDETTRINKVLAGRSSDEIKSMDALYKERYGTSLEDQFDNWLLPVDLQTRVAQANQWKAAQEQLQAGKGHVDRVTMTDIANKLHEFDGDNKAVDPQMLRASYTPKNDATKLLEGRTDAERAVIKEIYKEKYGEDLETHLKGLAGGERALRELDHTDAVFKGLPADKQPEAREKAEAIAASFVVSPTDKVDSDVIEREITKLNPAERNAVNGYFEEITGHTLEATIKDKFDGFEQEKLLSYLKYGSNDPVERVRLAILDGDDASLRTLLKTKNKAEIDEVSRLYQDRYHHPLYAVIANADHLSDGTKEVAALYLKGLDKRTPEDWEKLLKITLEADPKSSLRAVAAVGTGVLVGPQIARGDGDWEMYQELMRSMPPDIRKDLLVKYGEDIEDAFPAHSKNDFKHAKDYAEGGRLSLATKIADDTGRIWDNQAEIMRTMEQATPQERELYIRGAQAKKDWEEAHPDVVSLPIYNENYPIDPDQIKQEDRQAYDFFVEINNAASGRKQNSWRDALIYKGGSEQAIKDIETMSKEQWEDYHNHPEKQSAFIKKLSLLNDTDDRDKAIALFAQKILLSPTFEVADLATNTSITKKMSQFTKHFDAPDVYNAITGMTAADRASYKTDADFRESVDSWIKLKLPDEDQQHAALGMLSKLLNDKPPQPDLVDRLYKEAGEKDTDQMAVVRDLEHAFRESEEKGEKPTLRERLKNLSTNDDFAVRLDNAMHRVFHKSAEYDKYVVPLLSDGYLPLDQKMSLHSDEDDNKERIFQTVMDAANNNDAYSRQELSRFAKDSNYAESVLKQLPEDERQIAGYILAQGSVNPEDVARAYILGLGVEKDRVDAAIEKLTPDQKERMESDYARKYGITISAEFAEKLSGKEKREMMAKLQRDPKSTEEAVADSMAAVKDVRSGIGAYVTDAFSGSGSHAEDTYHKFAGEYERAKAKGDDLDPKRIKEHQENVRKDIELHLDAKKRAADDITNAVILVGTTVVSGGSLTIEAMVVLGATGGALKVAANKAMLGKYDDTSTAREFAKGFIDAAAASLGPEQFGKLMNIGEKAAVTATERTLADVAERGAQRIFVDGGQKELENGVKELVGNSIRNHTYEIKAAAVDALVNKATSEGVSAAEKLSLRNSLINNIQREIQSEVGSGLAKTLTEAGLHAGGGALGGAASGIGHGLTDWDWNRSFSENMSNVLTAGVVGGAFGAGMGLGVSSAMKVGGKALRIIGEKNSSKVARVLSAPEEVAVEGEFEIVRPKDAPLPAGTATDVSPRDLTQRYSQVGKSEYYVDSEGSILKKTGTNSDGSVKLVRDEQAVIAGSEDAVVAARKKATRMEAAAEGPSDLSAVRAPRARDTLHGTGGERVVPITERNPLVKDVMDQAGIPAEERAAHLARIKENKLAEPGVMDEFTRQMKDRVSIWKDRSDLARRGDETLEELRRATADYQRNIRNRLRAEGMQDREIAQLWDNPEALRTRFAGDPELRRVVAHYINARDANAWVQQQMKQVIDHRVAQIQEVLDKLADGQGLPRAKVVALDDVHMGTAVGKYGDGVIKLRQSDILTNSDPAAMMEASYHEFVHNQQDNLIIRSVIDDLERHSGKKLELRQDMGAIRSEYKTRTGRNISDDHLTEVVRARDGRTLDAHESARAAELADAFRNNAPPGEAFKKSGDDLAVTRGELNKLKEAGGAENLISRLSQDNGTLSQHLFASRTPPSEVQSLIDAFRRNEPLGLREEEISTLLKSRLEKREFSLWVYRRAVRRDYLSGFHEQEAFIIGRSLTARNEQAIAAHARRGTARAAEARPSPSGTGEGDDLASFPLDSSDGRATTIPGGDTAGESAANSSKSVTLTPQQVKESFSQIGDTTFYVNNDGNLYRRVGESADGQVRLAEDHNTRLYPVQDVHDMFLPNNYEYYFGSDAAFHELEGTRAYEYLKYRHNLERVAIGNKAIENEFPTLAIETTRAEKVTNALLEPGGTKLVKQHLEEFVPEYLWRGASGQRLTRAEVEALIDKIDTNLTSQADSLEFNSRSAKKITDRMVPPDREIQDGDVWHESAQYSDRKIRPMDTVMQEGMKFHIDKNQVELLKEIAEHQKMGEVPTGFIETKPGPARYKVQGWRQATPEERILPLTEITKNLKIVDYGFGDLGKMSLGVHDTHDHMLIFRMLKDKGLMGKDAAGRGYADLLKALGDFQEKDMFNRESELLASMAYNWRSFPEMHPSYDPPLALDDIAAALRQGFDHATANQREALKYVEELMAKDPYGKSTESKLLRHILSTSTTEAREQARKTGLSFLMTENSGPLEVISTEYPEYLALMVDVTRTLGDPAESAFLRKQNLRMEEYVRNVVNGKQDPGVDVTVKDSDIEASPDSSATVPDDTQKWMAAHPGFATRRAPIRNW